MMPPIDRKRCLTNSPESNDRDNSHRLIGPGAVKLLEDIASADQRLMDGGKLTNMNSQAAGTLSLGALDIFRFGTDGLPLRLVSRHFSG
jgi:hypothetical protein